MLLLPGERRSDQSVKQEPGAVQSRKGKSVKTVIICFFLTMEIAFASDTTGFTAGKPIWPAGREKEKNLFVGARVVFQAPAGGDATLRITASSLYRFFLNGEFLGHGPARGPHGFFRVDEWDLTGRCRQGSNILAIEVAGYNANSYYLLDQPSFLQAEIVSGGDVLAATGGKGLDFELTILPERVQKVQRYSFQRPFIEVYRLVPGFDRWRTDFSLPLAAVEAGEAVSGALLPRRVPYPAFPRRQPVREVSSGTVTCGPPIDRPWKDRSLTQIGQNLGGFPESELVIVPSLELQALTRSTVKELDRPHDPGTKFVLDRNAFTILDLGTNLSGFLGARISCREPTRFYFLFDEILSDGDVNFKRLGCVNAILHEMEPGTYEVESFEPYTLRYLKLLVLEGACEVEGIYLRELANPDIWEAHFACPDPRLLDLFAAGRETFAQNAVDIFMDCPSRERAGWLCDSFFTARTALDLSGDTCVEHNFYENYLLPDSFPHHPEGMLPMCYPADHNDGRFIPNWALWFVVELEEFQARGGDHAIVQALESKVLRLFEYFERFRNGDGLLEKLESWVFVEWSAANRFVQDVNYPSNMLFAAALAAAGRIYDRPGLLEEAEKVRAVIRKQSFDGQFFVDNAVRNDGKLSVTENRTEVCQYFAFFFNIATPESHTALWKTLCESFGPDRKERGLYPEIHEANAFIGNMLRMEILSRYGRCQQILDESIGYLMHMAERTGTLWENTGAYASCNHGFASHIVHTLYRDILGVYRIDPRQRLVTLRFTDVDLPWCEGRIPLDEGSVFLRWQEKGGKIEYRIQVPAGYAVLVENRSGKAAVRFP